MTRKGLVLCLAAIFAVGATVPVIAQDMTLSPQAAKLSKRALAKAKAALRTARAAKRQARLAGQAGTEAKQAAAAAGVAAGGAQAAVDSTRIRSALAAGEGTTTSEGFVALPGGPSVTVTVPASGLIEVWAQVTMDEAGAVSLYEDGQEMPGQSESCGPPDGGSALFSSPGVPGEFETVAVGTPAAIAFCGTEGPPGPVLFQTTPGQHTYELRYASCGCGEGGPGDSPVIFSQRRLFVAPRP